MTSSAIEILRIQRAQCEDAVAYHLAEAKTLNQKNKHHRTVIADQRALIRDIDRTIELLSDKNVSEEGF